MLTSVQVTPIHAPSTQSVKIPSDHTFVLADLDIPEMEKHALVNIESNVVKNEITRNFCESRTFALAKVILCEPHCLPAQSNRG